MESIFQSSKGLLEVNYFRKKGSSYVFGRNLIGLWYFLAVKLYSQLINIF